MCHRRLHPLNLSGVIRYGEGWHDAAMSEDPLVVLSELPGVFEATDAARAAIDGLLREPALRRDRGQVRAEARRHAAWASARLAGASLEVDDFAPPFPETDEGRLCAASLRVNGEVGALTDTWRRAPLQALARLHVLAAADEVPQSDLGRPRADPVVSARLSALADLVANSTASGMVVSAVVQADLLDLQPFGYADDLIARAASRISLVARGVDPDAITVPEEGLLRLGINQLEEAINGYRSGQPDGVTRWLVHFAASVQQGALVTRGLC